MVFGTGVANSTANASDFSIARTRISDATSTTICEGEHATSSTSSLPASIFDRSRIPLRRRMRWSLFLRIVIR